MADTRFPGIEVGRPNWGGVGYWRRSSVMEWISHMGKMHATSLGIDHGVESEDGLRGWIAGAQFELHHSISVQVSREG